MATLKTATAMNHWREGMASDVECLMALMAEVTWDKSAIAEVVLDMNRREQIQNEKLRASLPFSPMVAA